MLFEASEKISVGNYLIKKYFSFPSFTKHSTWLFSKNLTPDLSSSYLNNLSLPPALAISPPKLIYFQLSVIKLKPKQLKGSVENYAN